MVRTGLWGSEKSGYDKISKTPKAIAPNLLEIDSQSLGADKENFMKKAMAWYYRFLKRKKLSIRRVTSSGQKLPAGWETKRDLYLERLRKKVRIGNVKVSVFVRDQSGSRIICLDNKWVFSRFGILVIRITPRCGSI